jgi:hypothetical protein
MPARLRPASAARSSCACRARCEILLSGAARALASTRHRASSVWRRSFWPTNNAGAGVVWRGTPSARHWWAWSVVSQQKPIAFLRGSTEAPRACRVARRVASRSATTLSGARQLPASQRLPPGSSCERRDPAPRASVPFVLTDALSSQPGVQERQLQHPGLRHHQGASPPQAGSCE